MKISIKNFGPIREAKGIEIAPMTLFVGPSNTGKSYLAMLLYTIAKVLSISRRDVVHSLPEDDSAAEKLMKSLCNKRRTSAITPQETESLFLLWAKSIAGAWREAMTYCYGEESRNLVSRRMSAEVFCSNGGTVLNLTSPEKSRMEPKWQSLMVSEIQSVRTRLYDRNPSLEFLFNALLQRIELSSLSHLLLPSATTIPYYLPADRGGIMHSHRALISEAMQHVPMRGLGERYLRRMRRYSPMRPQRYKSMWTRQHAPMWPGLWSDFMQNLLELHKPLHLRGSNRKEIIAIGEGMESKIMAGKIKVDPSETGYPDYRYQFSSKRDLSLHNASSMVSELAPVSIFLRYHLNKGDLFIVEEPEAHLHPGGQRDISEVLAQSANAGVFVLATTHSDVVLEQISNFVHASRKKGGTVANIANGAVLTQKKLAVYSFPAGGKRGTIVETVTFNSTTGVVSQDHLDESTNLYNQTVRLLNG